MAVILAFLAALPILWSQLYNYQKARILTFLNPDTDQLGAGYQIAQSKIALGSGGLFGKGFLMGSQSQLNYLPEKQTDFVFTMIGEEFGFIGNLAVLFTYFIILMSCLLVALRSRNRFGQLLCTGISVMLFLYVFVNIGMVTGLLPVVGAPLPLISYGGKGANQALAAHVAGGKVNLIGCVGSDSEGDRYKSHLEQMGIDSSFLITSQNHETGSAFITVEDSGENSIVVNSGANQNLKRKDCLKKQVVN